MTEGDLELLTAKRVDVQVARGALRLSLERGRLPHWDVVLMQRMVDLDRLEREMAEALNHPETTGG